MPARRFRRLSFLTLSVIAAASVAATAHAEPAAEADDAGAWVFVSAPDFLNVDVADLSGLPGYQGRNSTNAMWEAAIYGYLAAIADESPAFVAVAGDLVMARWIQDGLGNLGGTGLFGPLLGSPEYPELTLEVEEERVRRAADLYYGEWVRRFDVAGLPFYAAVGDHELGDDTPTWHDQSQSNAGDRVAVPFGDIGRQTVPAHRAKFAEYFVEPLRSGERLAEGSAFVEGPSGGTHTGSAYAVRHGNVLLVTVDVFRQDDPADVPTADVVAEQLDWLKQTLADAKRDPTIAHVFVQGHTPVLYEGFDIQRRMSSSLRLEGRQDSPFWKALLDGGVDVYLAGEVHDVTASRNGDEPLLQVSHGGILGFQRADSISYLVVTVVDDDTIGLEAKSLGVAVGGPRFFQPANPGSILRSRVTLDPEGTGPYSNGRVTIDKSTGTTVYRDATGVFAHLAGRE